MSWLRTVAREITFTRLGVAPCLTRLYPERICLGRATSRSDIGALDYEVMSSNPRRGAIARHKCDGRRILGCSGGTIRGCPDGAGIRST